MVDVPHHGDNRWTADEVCFIIHFVFLSHRFDDFSTDEVGLVAKLLSDHIDGLCIQTHIDRHHQPNAHAGSDDLGDGDVHHAR